MSRNDDRILGHADESDGIEEYDNPLPDWWLGLFFVTVVWGVIYWADWTYLRPKTQESLYEVEVAEAKARWPDLERPQGIDSSPETLALGAETFQTTCSSCHGAELRGGIGPSLVDDEWIHGGDFEAISRTISEGVAAKGMPAWGTMLGPKKVAALASFVLSKHEGGAAAPPASGLAADAVAAVGDGAAEPADAGAQVFRQNCVACHGADLTGGVGPNLVDGEWIHGGQPADIRRVIENGVPAKGMITWKGVLTDDQIEAVTAFIVERGRTTE